MGDAKDEQKRQKKAHKAEGKRVKKLAKAGVGASVPLQPPQAASDSASGPTPAERSATAAERQVRLQKLRVAIALVAALVALAGFLITVKPWKYLSSQQRDTPPPALPSTSD